MAFCDFCSLILFLSRAPSFFQVLFCRLKENSPQKRKERASGLRVTEGLFALGQFSLIPALKDFYLHFQGRPVLCPSFPNNPNSSDNLYRPSLRQNQSPKEVAIAVAQAAGRTRNPYWLIKSSGFVLLISNDDK